MTRSTSRTLAAAAAAAALALTAGCSLIPGLGGDSAAPPPPAAPSASAPASKAATGTASATGTPAATSTPAVSKSSSGTAIPVPNAPATSGDRKISSDVDGIELRELQGKGAQVIDLRSKKDFAKEHIQGAVNLPMSDFAANAEGWPRGRTVVVYDRTGAVSQSAQTWLEENGFTRIYHLFRGMEGYDAALVGNDPSPIPPRRPVLYYFTIDVNNLRPGQPLYNADRAVIKQADEFVQELQSEFGGDLEFHSYDITTSDGLGQFMEFEGDRVPLFRLVNHDGRSEQLTGKGTFEVVRAHIRKSVQEFHADETP